MKQQQAIAYLEKHEKCLTTHTHTHIYVYAQTHVEVAQN